LKQGLFPTTFVEPKVETKDLIQTLGFKFALTDVSLKGNFRAPNRHRSDNIRYKEILEFELEAYQNP